MKSALHYGRRRVLGAVVALVALGITGCAAEQSDGGSTSSAPSAAAADGVFPVTVESALGTATIPAAPQRVVTLGQGSAETAIALGQIPVGIEKYEWGSDSTGYLPWIHEAVTKAGAELPKQFAGGDTLDVEAILELDPDVILAPWSGITQEQYDVLSGIAPTVAYPGKAWSTDWDEQIKIIGRALGKPSQAQGLIDQINQRFADAAASRPNYPQHTFSYIYTNGPGTLGVFLPTEQRVAMVAKLGLKVDPVVETFPETEGTDSALIGLEKAEELRNSELIFTFYTDAQTRREIEAQPLYAAIPAVAKGAVVASDDNPFVTASSMINPLTVPWVIDRYLPQIDEKLALLDKK
ncbi:iron-siderophore ABC transporter substrate-binding protein [Goodfellowiella coeruleoviolacea]|uniref:Iron complex transport system substrate-binding protein n=1 Tax=Goodfellowiella coeruleoviolacea TaxID=334858 RepID=A0AAE3KIH8_9PSEU|nr:iron-siderophore ABC transporter substrate-binding protein [Goodfellowiella coeruleoviolacea]MCP2163283.1 iron complex transport system substrate-binding protein [Goodfellowiella coeruleoviolacea]